MGGKLHTGDNLQIMRGLPSASIDLIYLDPPFNTARSLIYSKPVQKAIAREASKK